MRKGIGAVQAAAMLLLGIFIGQKTNPPLALCILLFGICTAGGGFFFLKGRKYTLDQPPKRISRLLFCLALLALGLGRTAVTSRERGAGSVEKYAGMDAVSFTGAVIAPPVSTASRTTLRVAVDSRQASADVPDSGKLLLVFYRKPDTEFHYGDRLRISGRVILPPDTGSSFSYRTYLERDGITAMINNPRVELLPGFEGDPFASALYRLRAVLLDRVYELFPKGESALMAGILLGDESKITSDVDRAFQQTGTAHIIAISGANFTVLTWLVLSILRRLIHQWWAPLFMLSFIFFYTALVGGNAAVVRAAVMCSLSIVGMTLGRTGSGINNLSLTAAGMALVKPGIIFDLGFQLSVTATLGIMLFSTPINGMIRALIAKLFPKISENTLTTLVAVLNDLCILSISAQIFTVWVSAAAFGRISLISLPANFLIAPFQSLIMLGGFAALILSFLFYPLGAAAAWLIWPAPALTIRIVEKCAEFRWGSVYFDLPPVQAWLIIAAIIGVYLGRNQIVRSIRARNFRPYALLLLVFASVMLWVSAADRLDRRAVIGFVSTQSSFTLKVRSPEKRLFIIAEGLTNYAGQTLLEKQVLPVRRLPEAAWFDLQEDWMSRELLSSGAADELSVFYLDGKLAQGQDKEPRRIERGFRFSADGIGLEMAASYLNKKAWIVTAYGKTILFPNGIPAGRIFTRQGAQLSGIDLIVLGKRDSAASWRDDLALKEHQPTLLDLSAEGSGTLYISEKGTGIL